MEAFDVMKLHNNAPSHQYNKLAQGQAEEDTSQHNNQYQFILLKKYKKNGSTKTNNIGP